ncbi:ABC transporter ATP-binding protein [Limnohabitans sp. 2KL-51]|uniref:ABC transporter ATP-binding protein n=1 Tax=Limnohabitans sp. 2KL-51 TaxID=1977911 RepID=UPI000D365ED7|nr:ABC transporter ATP-binding protein [Limnohabitans sp. 2KL-51]PUE45404.1 dipeptide ABC transporter ATP-binding protein DppD [Limnohabitans sp. 2KL-51]
MTPIDSITPLTSTPPLLEVKKLSIAFRTRNGVLPVTNEVSFSIGKAERLGLVGESGCGKTVTGLALMRLLDPTVAVVTGEIWLNGRNILALPEHEMRSLRGRELAMIFQEPMSALDPVFTVGDQISDAFRAHFPQRSKEAKERTLALLAQVGIAAPQARYNDYPHQMSGGMRQRIMIAMALICEPHLIIADEPTTALDVTVQAQIMELMRELSDRTGTSLLFITHDLGVVAETCQRMVTMYAGQVVEDAPVDSALLTPLHPYTSGLLRSLPRFAKRREPLGSIPGRVPAPQDMIEGCRFKPRCASATFNCENEQVLENVVGSQRKVRCVRASELSLPGVQVA